MNFLKVVPLFRLSAAMAHGQSRGPNGGLPVVYKVIEDERRPVVTSTAGFIKDQETETIFNEIHWELTLEGK